MPEHNDDRRAKLVIAKWATMVVLQPLLRALPPSGLRHLLVLTRWMRLRCYERVRRLRAEAYKRQVEATWRSNGLNVTWTSKTHARLVCDALANGEKTITLPDGRVFEVVKL